MCWTVVAAGEPALLTEAAADADFRMWAMRAGSMADGGVNVRDVETEPLREPGSVLNPDAVPVPMSPFGSTATARQTAQKRLRIL